MQIFIITQNYHFLAIDRYLFFVIVVNLIFKFDQMNIDWDEELG